MNDKSSFIKVPITKHLVITEQLKLYFNNSSRIPIEETNLKKGMMHIAGGCTEPVPLDLRRYLVLRCVIRRFVNT
jgi:hypothetical protein